MAGERGQPTLNGVQLTSIPLVESFVGTITPSDTTVYDPPLTMLYATGAGNVVLVYAADSETVAANYDTVAVSATSYLTGRAIRQVRATGNTATGIKGYR